MKSTRFESKLTKTLKQRGEYRISSEESEDLDSV